MATAKKIAVIEDDQAILEMYKLKLSNSGFSITTAMNGEDGFEVCQKEKPDLILLDLKMPLMNGEEMLEKLRETDWGADIRVVILTNISRDEAPHKLRFLNVDRYIVKAHHTPAQVVDVVCEVLNIKHR